MRPDDLGIYIHWPFCESKCGYCDFNSHVRDSVDQQRWRLALCTDLHAHAAHTRDRRVVSVFFGGGTPSLMAPETVACLIAQIKTLWATDEALEITLEANPSSVEAGRFAAFAAAGVTRLSLGVQSFDDAALRFLTRRHDAQDARRALEIAQAHFPRVSFDLIYARPGQSVAAWRAELAEALRFQTEHLSLYQLTIEPNTGFAGHYQRQAFALPDEGESLALFQATQDDMTMAGLPLYEVSNHARPGAMCQHNLVYWRYCDYIGIGPGAHGRYNAAATVHLKRPEAWLEAVEKKGTGLENITPLSPHERAEEAVLMGLRLVDGVQAAWFKARTGLDLWAVINPLAHQRYVEDGLLIDTTEACCVTPAGMVVLNHMIPGLLAASGTGDDARAGR